MTLYISVTALGRLKGTDPGCLHGSLTVRELGLLPVLNSLQALQKAFVPGALTITYCLWAAFSIPGSFSSASLTRFTVLFSCF